MPRETRVVVQYKFEMAAVSVQYFLEYHGYRNPSSLSSVIDTLADINSKKLIQTTIDDFLF